MQQVHLQTFPLNLNAILFLDLAAFSDSGTKYCPVYAILRFKLAIRETSTKLPAKLGHSEFVIEFLKTIGQLLEGVINTEKILVIVLETEEKLKGSSK